jgi:hypothetical protein
LTNDFIIKKLKDQFQQVPCFTRKELHDFYLNFEPELNESTFRWRIHNLKAKHLLRNIDKDTFSLSFKPSFTANIESKSRDIFLKVQKSYPHAKGCIWSTKWLNEFMLHQPFKFMTLLEVEESAVESVFHFLQDEGLKELFLEPDEKEIEKYISENSNPIVVKTLLTGTPLQKMDKVVAPMLEKILVDIYCEKALFSAFQGSELSFIFKTCFEKYAINQTTLLRYASRRGKRLELTEFIITETNAFKPDLHDR